VNKGEVVARLARETGLTKVDAGRVLDAFVEQVLRSLKKGEKVKILGFGTFDVFRRRARNGVDPRSGAPIRIPARRWPRFTASKELRAAVK
jgi:DNA-binding protein HU-beta